MTDDRTPGAGPDMSDPDVMAAELALGLLEGEDRAAALRRVIADPDFAREVERWRDHFAVLFADAPEIAAPTGLFARVERTLSPPANDTGPVRSTGSWRGAAISASLIAATLVAVIALRPEPKPVAPPVIAAARVPVLVAAITPVAKGAPVAALYDPQTGDLRVAAAALVQAGHSAELWVIAKDGVPVSLGVLDEAHAKSVAVGVANRARFAVGSTLAVTVEPVGGSPSGKPTGAVVASGALALV